jgi:Skp family chaperone for outer membrane proteins
MKTIKVFSSIVLLSLCMVSFGQTTATSPAVKTSVYLVQVPHTPEQCLKTLDDLKGKGDAFLSKFEFGCMSGDHTGYAFLSGNSEDDVRQMLPKDVQKTAKVQKVDKFTADQIDKLHKGKM